MRSSLQFRDSKVPNEGHQALPFPTTRYLLFHNRAVWTVFSSLIFLYNLFFQFQSLLAKKKLWDQTVHPRSYEKNHAQSFILSLRVCLRFLFILFLKSLLYRKKQGDCSWFKCILIVCVLITFHKSNHFDQSWKIKAAHWPVRVKKGFFTVWFVIWVSEMLAPQTLWTLQTSTLDSPLHFSSETQIEWRKVLWQEQCSKKPGLLWHRHTRFVITVRKSLDSFDARLDIVD